MKKNLRNKSCQSLNQRVGVLNNKLEKIEGEKAELENALIVSTQSVEAANTQLLVGD